LLVDFSYKFTLNNRQWTILIPAEFYLNIAGLKRSAMRTFVFYIALIICYLLIYVLLTLYGLSIKDWQIEWELAYKAVFMNSSINVMLASQQQMLCKQTEEN